VNYNEIKQKIKKLYKIFFYGDEITQFERSIEIKYLAEKQAKWYVYIKEKKKNHLNQCIWTYNNQRCLEGYQNWRTRDLNLFDDFRPIYQVIIKFYNLLTAFFYFIFDVYFDEYFTQ
jgi:hypothetical protein